MARGRRRGSAAMNGCCRTCGTCAPREPLNEQAHAYLMTALAATGQQAAAVMLFGELMHRLDRELGIRPGPQLAATHVRIMRR